MTQSDAVAQLLHLRDRQQRKLRTVQAASHHYAYYAANMEARYAADVVALTMAIRALEIKAPPRRGDLPLWAKFLSCAILGAAVAACVIYALL